MHVLVSGSSGLIGGAVARALEDAGHRVRRLVRRASGPGDALWDPATGTIDEPALTGVDAVVHLAGEPIGARRWSEAQRARIRDSRVQGTSLLAGALARLDPRPRVLVSGSAVGYYGDRGDETLTELSPPGDGFLAQVCREWEAATVAAEEAGIRVVRLRTGIVLARGGGALARQLPLFRIGLGGALAGGRQYVSWISLDDEVGAILHLLAHDEVHGAVNATAPAPVTNAVLTRALARAVRRPAVLPVPRLGLYAVLGRGLADSILESQRAVPARLLATGYAFAHPDVDAALREVLHGPAP